MAYLVDYDIADPKRLRKVAWACEDFGLRKQYSVFFVDYRRPTWYDYAAVFMTSSTWTEIRSCFVPLYKRCAGLIKAIGRPIEPHDARDMIIVS